MSFGLYIRQRRIELGYGLNEFSARIGISPAYWSRVERGIEPFDGAGGGLRMARGER